jgi:hypothetical protein
MRRFLVTGCPRSGTKYIAELFKALGVRMGHEDVFGVRQGLGGRPDWQDFQGEASWLAVPHLPLDGVVVLHQVRHPLEFVRSAVGYSDPGFLSDRRRRYPIPSVVGLHAPEVYGPATQAERSATMWRVWNARAEQHAALTFRIEDLDAGLLLRLCGLVELQISEALAGRVLAGVSKTTNRTQRDEAISWEQIEPFIGDAAARYGYAAI